MKPEEALEALIAACEDAFDTDDRAWPDDADVMTPPAGITFGMIRRARDVLERSEGRLSPAPISTPRQGGRT